MPALDTLKQEWHKDSAINDLDLRSEALRNTQLHSKYMNIMMDHSVALETLKSAYKKERLFKTQYYSGKLNEDTELLNKRNLEPMRVKVKLKSEIEEYLEADDELSAITQDMAMEDKMIFYCQEVIKWLRSRSYDIQGAMKYEIFQNGG